MSLQCSKVGASLPYCKVVKHRLAIAERQRMQALEMDSQRMKYEIRRVQGGRDEDGLQSHLLI